jgi:tRNA(fMet)-specific endonuclease VapC
MKYLLDTSVYSQPLKRFPLPGVIQKWKAVGDAACCISVFCELEVLQGIRAVESSSLAEKYVKILKDRIPILDFTPAEAKVFADLQADSIRNGRTRPVIDLCIAATALRHGCILATLNSRDFTDIPGLVVEDWGE